MTLKPAREGGLYCVQGRETADTADFTARKNSFGRSKRILTGCIYAGGKVDKARPVAVKMGMNHVTSLVEERKAKLVVIAHDVDPVEVKTANQNPESSERSIVSFPDGRSVRSDRSETEQ